MALCRIGKHLSTFGLYWSRMESSSDNQKITKHPFRCASLYERASRMLRWTRIGHSRLDRSSAQLRSHAEKLATGSHHNFATPPGGAGWRTLL